MQTQQTCAHFATHHRSPFLRVGQLLPQTSCCQTCERQGVLTRAPEHDVLVARINVNSNLANVHAPCMLWVATTTDHHSCVRCSSSPPHVGQFSSSKELPSSRGARAPMIAATIAFASHNSCKPGAVELPALCSWVAVSGSRYLKSVSSGSSSVGEHEALRLAVPLQSPLSRRQCSATDCKFTVSHLANFLALAPHNPSPSD